MPSEYLNCVKDLVAKGIESSVAKRRCAIAYYRQHGRTPQQDESSIHSFLEACLPLSVADPCDLRDGDFLLLSEVYKHTPYADRSALLVEGNAPYRTYPISVHGAIESDLWVLAWHLAPKKLRGKLKGRRPAGVVVMESGLVLPADDRRVQTYESVVEDDIVVLEDVGADEADKASSDDVILRFKGTVLVDDVLSRSGREPKPAYYSSGANDVIMHETNLAIADDGPLTLYVSHDAFISGGLPFGMIVDSLFRENSAVHYIGQVLGTVIGRDVAMLLRNRVLRRSSLRSFDFDKALDTLEDGREVFRVLRGVIAGIDLTEAPGIEGADIVSTFEDTTTEVDNMEINWDEITMEDLRSNRQDLLDELLVGMTAEGADTATHGAQIRVLTTENATLENAVGELVERIDTLEGSLTTANERLDAASEREERNALIVTLTEGVEHSDLVVEELRGSSHTLEDLKERGEEIVTATVQRLESLAKRLGGSTFAGEDENDGGETPTVLEDARQAVTGMLTG